MWQEVVEEASPVKETTKAKEAILVKEKTLAKGAGEQNRCAGPCPEAGAGQSVVAAAVVPLAGDGLRRKVRQKEYR